MTAPEFENRAFSEHGYSILVFEKDIVYDSDPVGQGFGFFQNQAVFPFVAAFPVRGYDSSPSLNNGIA